MMKPPTGAHRRLNPLTGEHVLVSSQRLQRPWQGNEAAPAVPSMDHHDPDCYLCPGNLRANGERNPDYAGTFVFDNDFAALQADDDPDRHARTASDAGSAFADEEGLLVARPERGRCRVVCFSPRHDLTLAQLDGPALEAVVSTWRAEAIALAADEDIAYVQIFENKGELMGCSNPHPHGQIWAQSSIPDVPARELERMAAWYAERGTPLLMDYAHLELKQEERLVAANEHFLVVVPWWASWPFETLLLPRRPIERLADFSDVELGDFAALVGVLTRAYDRLFGVSFPYSSGIHQAPADGKEHPHCTLHMHFYPPLLRSATVRKFMVGYEMLAEAQRDLTPESAAERLRDCLG